MSEETSDPRDLARSILAPLREVLHQRRNDLIAKRAVRPLSDAERFALEYALEEIHCLDVMEADAKPEELAEIADIIFDVFKIEGIGTA